MTGVRKSTIDGKEYVFDTLPDTVKQNLANLRVVDREVARLQNQLAIAQTARAVFANSIQTNLPQN